MLIRSFVHRMRHVFYVLRRKRYLKVDSDQYGVSQYGNDYGGFQIYDKDIKKKENAIVYSFGIGEDLSFSEDLMKKFAPQIFAFDPTPRSIKYVKSHELSRNVKFSFSPIGLSDKDEKTRFYLPINHAFVSGSAVAREGLEIEGVDVTMECLNTISKKNGHAYIDLLKMDIEGSEFKVIEALKDNGLDIKQICMEIHDEFFNDGIKKLRRALKTMRELGYILISVSGRGTELTFLKTKE